MNKESKEAFGRLEQILFPGVAAEKKKGEFPGVDVTDPVASAVVPVETKQVVQSAGEPLFQCLECGKKFYTTASAERAANNGCPKCGGVDIDTYVKSERKGPMNDLMASLWKVERGLVLSRRGAATPGSPSEEVEEFVSQAKKCRDILVQIDKLLDRLEKVDPYGDMIENFSDEDKRTRVTTRLIDMIDEGLKGK